MTLVSWLAVGLTCATLLSCRPGVSAEHVLSVEARPMDRHYPVGASILFGFAVKNVSPNPWELRTGISGVPSGLVAVLDSQGRVMPFPAKTLFPAGGPPSRIPDAEVYKLAPGEGVELRYDLACLADLRNPGDYRVRLQDAGGVLFESAFTICEFKTIEQREVQGAFPGVGFASPKNATPVSCRVSLIETASDGLANRYLCIDAMRIWGNNGDMPAQCLALPIAAAISDTRMDFHGQVWIVVRDGSRQSLILWRLATAQYDILVPWSEHEVEIGATRAFWHISGQDIVVAGPKGKPKFTILSVGLPIDQPSIAK